MRLVALVALPFMWCSAAVACQSEEQRSYTERAKTISPAEICNAVASGITGRSVLCPSNRYSQDQVEVVVTRTLRSEIAEFDVLFLARSDRLSGRVGDRGFESHKYKILLFHDFQCRNMIWTYTYEPRYIRAGFHVAKNLSNPNWTLYSDGDRLTALEELFRTWVVEELSRPFRR